MAIKDRDKASDIFRKTDFVFSKKVSFEEAFPTIADIEITVVETGTDVFDGTRKCVYKSAENFREFMDCSNRLCYGGGVSLGDVVREMVRNNLTEHKESKICQGYEGSPKGRRKYRSCVNFFKIHVKLKYK